MSLTADSQTIIRIIYPDISGKAFIRIQSKIFLVACHCKTCKANRNARNVIACHCDTCISNRNARNE